MASDLMLKRLNTANSAFLRVNREAAYSRLRNDERFQQAFAEAQLLASKWFSRTKDVAGSIEDWVLEPFVLFLEQASEISSGRGISANETFAQGLTRVAGQFKTKLPILAFEVLDAKEAFDAFEKVGATGKSALDGIQTAAALRMDSIHETADGEIAKIQAAARDAAAEFEYVKTAASKISVESALEQFREAKKQLKNRAIGWTLASVAFFVLLILMLLHLFFSPPLLVLRVEQAMGPGTKDIPLPVSIPLLVAASAYFTAVRLALIGVLGVGLAVSLRMMRAYYHMMEHNNHRLRVTNSIQAFVNAIRTPAQKDLILGKLVESVTDFGDSGILGGQPETQAWPSVVMESITKNITKPD